MPPEDRGSKIRFEDYTPPPNQLVRRKQAKGPMESINKSTKRYGRQIYTVNHKEAVIEVSRGVEVEFS